MEERDEVGGVREGEENRMGSLAEEGRGNRKDVERKDKGEGGIEH